MDDDGATQVLTFDQAVSLLTEWRSKIVAVSFGQGECVGRLLRVVRDDARPRRGSVIFGCGKLTGGAEIDFFLRELEFRQARVQANETQLTIDSDRGRLVIERDPPQYASDEIS
jgi:hypothetical protein